MIRIALRRLIDSPGYVVRHGIALLRGCYYIIRYRVSKYHVVIKFPFRAFAPVRIIGPGSVFIDKNCIVVLNAFEGLKIVTLSPNAKVVIGEKCALGGVTIRCRARIEIGEKSMFANSLMQDVLFVEKNDVRSRIEDHSFMDPKPIHIGRNAWLGTKCCILGGSIVGDDAVIGNGSVCNAYNVKEYCLALGNPVKNHLPIKRILRLKCCG